MANAIAELQARLQARIRSYGSSRAMVAVSGGVDSAVVLALAVRTIGAPAVIAVTAVSASYPEGELEQARRLARALEVEHRTVSTGEVEQERYAVNDAMRCFHCKTELYTTLRRLPGSDGVVILAGANADDAEDFRPGLLAAPRHGVHNPLLEEGVGKEMVRSMARELGLEVAEKPALACLSSRIAYGIRVTPELLARIDRAEQLVRSLGFQVVRVRHFGKVCTIEVPPADLSRLAGHPDLAALTRSLHDLGWERITVDPQGLRSGSLNASLTLSPALARRMTRSRTLTGSA